MHQAMLKPYPPQNSDLGDILETQTFSSLSHTHFSCGRIKIRASRLLLCLFFLQLYPDDIESF